MRLFKYMDRSAYLALLRDGRLVGSPKHSTFPQFAPAYAWLAEAMASRIGPAPTHADPVWPVFAWHSYDERHPVARDPDNGNESSHLLVGFDAPDATVLLSDFDDWHYVLNGWYLPPGGSADDSAENNAAADAFDSRETEAGYDRFVPPAGGPDPCIEADRRASWSRVVDRPFDNGSVQATLWEVRLEWVFYVKARKRRALPSTGRSILSAARRASRAFHAPSPDAPCIPPVP